jgi:hypothetical protein
MGVEPISVLRCPDYVAPRAADREGAVGILVIMHFVKHWRALVGASLLWFLATAGNPAAAAPVITSVAPPAAGTYTESSRP